MIYTTKSGARVLGIKQDTLKFYATKFGVGSQPGGPKTPWLFTDDDLREIREREQKWGKVEEMEDREAFGLGPIFNEDLTPNR